MKQRGERKEKQSAITSVRVSHSDQVEDVTRLCYNLGPVVPVRPLCSLWLIQLGTFALVAAATQDAEQGAV